MKRDYDSTLARIAGNIASGMMENDLPDGPPDQQNVIIAMKEIAIKAVAQARAIIEEVHVDALGVEMQTRADRMTMQAIMQVLGPKATCECVGCQWETDEAIRLLQGAGIFYQRGKSYRDGRTRPSHDKDAERRGGYQIDTRIEQAVSVAQEMDEKIRQHYIGQIQEQRERADRAEALLRELQQDRP